MESEVCTTCGGALNQGDHTHGDAAPADGGAESAPAAAPADAAPAPEAAKPWWKFW